MKTWTKADILILLASSDKAVARAIVAIYNRQTFTEQTLQQTEEHNGIGFNGFDAPFLSSLAEQYFEKGFLTKAQIDGARKLVKKYAGQLVEIANENERKKAPEQLELDEIEKSQGKSYLSR